MKRLGFGIGAAIVLAACGSNVDGGGAPSLEDQGTIEGACAPNDGPAVAVKVGAPSACGAAAGSSPFVQFYAYPLSTRDLAEGKKWTVGRASASEAVQGTWFPKGSTSEPVTVKSGSFEVLSLSESEAVVRYELELPTGESYAGEATVSLCPSTSPMCG